MYTNIIFDFDGTIADTEALLVGTINGLAPKYGLKALTMQQIAEFKNRPLFDLLGHFRFPIYKLPFLAKEVHDKVMDGLLTTNVFPGMAEVIRSLKSQGMRLYIMSSNSEGNVRSFIRRNDLDIFEAVHCSMNVFGKSSALRILMRKQKLDPEYCIYIGDEVRDVVACKKIGLPIISVLWGYNTEAVLRKYDPEYLVKTPQEILDIVFK